MENLAEFLFILGLVLLIVEVLVLSLSTIILFMVGSSLILTAVAIYLGLLGNSLLDAILVVGVLTAVLTVVLWKPFKRLQEQRDDSPVTSDLVGFTFVLADAVEPDGCVMYKYSGIEWRLVSAVPIASGTKVRVVEVEVGQWHVEPF